ncbi:MAG TPA: hypothetical protein VJN96_20865 [Vicinamibacterales bacterium]|nr:hypothetical protein [Vicinamibacterales bacterium]
MLTVIGVPLATLWEQQRSARVWEELDRLAIARCLEDEALPGHPRALDCANAAGADKTFFEHEHTTPLQYWLTGFAIMFILDLIATGLIVAFVLAVRWVVRGFRKPA